VVVGDPVLDLSRDRHATAPALGAPKAFPELVGQTRNSGRIAFLFKAVGAAARFLGGGL